METATEKPSVRMIWENCRPAAEAFQVVTALGLDPLELEDLEDKWHRETVPFLNNKLGWEPVVAKELERLIRFAEDRIKVAEEEYGRNNQPFSKRRYLMEKRIPVAQEFLKKYQSWQDKNPAINWEPMDVVDIKRRGIEAFIRSNLERFYS